MTQRLPHVDPDDPRAPAQDEWDRLTEEERRLVVAMLPDEVPIDVMAPEGDPHRQAKSSALDALGRYFQRIGRRVYLSSELAVYYPGERRLVLDVFAVLDVEPHERMKWVVNIEGKGLDFVLEVHVTGDAAKDHERNVATYARLGVPEYFVYDRGRARLRGWQLPSAQARAYEPIVPQEGRFASRVLGLDLALDGTRLRFFHGTAALAEADDLIAKLGTMVDELIAKREDVERLLEQERQRTEQERHRAEDAERRLQQALEELERLRRGR